MEPKIYKPSIYKGAGIYKAGGGLKYLNENYIICDWISSTLTGGIGIEIPNLNISDDEKVKYKAKIRVVPFSGSSAYIFSSSQINGNSSASIRFTNINKCYATNRNNYSNEYNFTSIANKIVDVELEKDTLKIDENVFTNVPYALESLGRIYVLGENRRHLFLYEFVVENDGVKILDILPVIKRYTGEVYLYDKVNNQFYSNSSIFAGFD